MSPITTRTLAAPAGAIRATDVERDAERVVLYYLFAVLVSSEVVFFITHIGLLGAAPRLLFGSALLGHWWFSFGRWWGFLHRGLFAFGLYVVSGRAVVDGGAKWWGRVIEYLIDGV